MSKIFPEGQYWFKRPDCGKSCLTNIRAIAFDSTAAECAAPNVPIRGQNGDGESSTDLDAL